ncbi:MAG: hypothetical protein NVSMB64_32550 [Candidatus Velthaea sp.]
MQKIKHYATPVYATLLAIFSAIALAFLMIVYRFDVSHPGVQFPLPGVQFPLDIRVPFMYVGVPLCSVGLAMFVWNVASPKDAR